MNEPMSDERLGSIRDYLAREDPPGARRFLMLSSAREMLAEIDRLRAALAARPEPIGYVGVRRYTDRAFDVVLASPAATLPEVSREVLRLAENHHPCECGAEFRVCALVPVEDGTR